MSSYTIVTGDTFDLIGRKTGNNAGTVRAANPGAFEPLVPGNSLVIPDSPRTSSAPQVSPDNQVSLFIDQRQFRFWTELTVTRQLDGFTTVEFLAPFEREHRAIFQPFSYKLVSVGIGGENLFTGLMVAINPDLQPNSRSLSVSCYAAPAVISDCNAPASLFPLQFINADLRTIASDLLFPFGLSVQFAAPVGAPFRTLRLQSADKVFPFLAELAKQRNLVITNTSTGALLFYRAITGDATPVATLSQGQSPVLSVVPQFDPQQYYSHITGIAPTAVGAPGSQFTVKNPRLTTVVRPFTFQAADSEVGNISQATENKLARMFANVASYTVSVNTWRDPQGQLWQPNTLIRLSAPDAMIYNPYTFLIRSVTLRQAERAQTAELNIVLPGSFSGNAPESLPWDL